MRTKSQLVEQEQRLKLIKAKLQSLIEEVDEALHINAISLTSIIEENKEKSV